MGILRAAMALEQVVAEAVQGNNLVVHRRCRAGWISLATFPDSTPASPWTSSRWQLGLRYAIRAALPGHFSLSPYMWFTLLESGETGRRDLGVSHSPRYISISDSNNARGTPLNSAA
jgi:hypothetical protein